LSAQQQCHHWYGGTDGRLKENDLTSRGAIWAYQSKIVKHAASFRAKNSSAARVIRAKNLIAARDHLIDRM
jgi:hypothetical protein